MMATTENVKQHTKRWALALFACALSAGLLLGLGATPAHAQDNGSASAKKQKLEDLKKAYAGFQQAGKNNNFETAYAKLSEAVQLAEETDQSGALGKLRGFQQRLPTKWGNEALKQKNYEQALQHFRKGEEWSPKDAYVYYGQGLALVNMDSTEAAMTKMKEAIEVGNANGDTRTANLAADRIRQEFIAKASKALSAQNPTESNANEALEQLDSMREYVEPNAKALFYRATALYTKRQYDDAISMAQQGLEKHQGSRTDEAKYHFVIAESQMKQGNKSAACSTFQQSAYGDYKARSEHYLKNECEN